MQYINIKRPFVLTAAAFSTGIITGHYLGFPFVIFSILFLSIIYYLYSKNLLPANIRIEQKDLKTILIIFIIFLAGFSSISWQEIKYNSDYSTAAYNGDGLQTVRGVVREDLRSLQGNKVLLKPYLINEKSVKYGLIQLDKRYLPRPLHNGDLVEMDLYLNQPERQRNPGGFSSYNYLKRKGIYSKGYFEGDLKVIGDMDYFFVDGIIALKNRFISILDNTVDSPYNELFKAFLLGERGGLPDEWDQFFTRAGVNHLLAISGLHVGFIVAIFLYLFRFIKCPVGIRNFIITLLLLIYIILTGFRASVFRAGVLSIAFIWAPFFQRKGDILNILGLTAFLNLCLNPYQLFSVGFQLSYFVLLMILFWHEILKKRIKTIFAVSIAAFIGSSPITVYYFNIITPVSIISNIWAIPLVGFIVSTALIALFLGFIHPAISEFIYSLLIYPVRLLISGTEYMSKIPLSNLEFASPSIYMLIFWVIVIAIFPFILKERKLPPNRERYKKYSYYLCIICLFIVFVNILIPFFDNDLEITFLDVGQGDSVLIKSPREGYVLVDGGGYAGMNATQGEYTILPYLKHRGIKELSVVAITHFDADHSVGILDLLGNRKIKLILVPYNYDKNKIAKLILAKAEEYSVPVVQAGDGDDFTVDGLIFEIMSPVPGDKPLSRNENSLVMKMIYKDFSLLLTGDLEIAGEERLVQGNYDLKSDILKLGHHGSNSSSSEAFLDQVIPDHAVISAGKNNNYGHPAPRVLERVKDNDIRYWRTDKNGAIKIYSDGY
ncbi:MAG: DNA internalization-related competence protein ComEC/Rec2, partial [Bacillota bacterium]